MPQFDVSTFTSQIFWLGVTFFLFYLFLRSVIIPRMALLLKERWEQTEGHVKKSDDLLSEADLLGRTYEKGILYAREDAKHLLQKTRDQLALTVAQEKAKILNQINFKLESDKRRIAEEKAHLLEEVDQASQSLVDTAYEKLQTPSHPLLKEEPWTSH